MTRSALHVERVDAVTQELVESFGRLLPMLSSSAQRLSLTDLDEVARSQCLRVARDMDAGGSLTLVMFRIPTGLRAWIEDVVVDESTRGKGVGEQPAHEALDLAAAGGAKTIDLTSNKSRLAAHRLYEMVGCSIRETNVYRYQPH